MYLPFKAQWEICLWVWGSSQVFRYFSLKVTQYSECGLNGRKRESLRKMSTMEVATGHTASPPRSLPVPRMFSCIPPIDPTPQMEVYVPSSSSKPRIQLGLLAQQWTNNNLAHFPLTTNVTLSQCIKHSCSTVMKCL